VVATRAALPGEVEKDEGLPLSVPGHPERRARRGPWGPAAVDACQGAF